MAIDSKVSFNFNKGSGCHHFFLLCIVCLVPVLNSCLWAILRQFFHNLLLGGNLYLFAVEDLERNDGSTEKPYFMSSNLRKLLKKTNKQQADA